MSYIKIMVHVVWATKAREPLLVKENRAQLFNHIRENARLKDIYIDTIGGHADHVHCLISLGAEQSIAKIVQLIKGESSYWANKENAIKPRLVWAADYFAASVSESALQKVRDYINNQEEHHRKITFKEEYDKFVISHGFELATDGATST
jgi:REP element-mobilizing transposase RayT